MITQNFDFLLHVSIFDEKWIYNNIVFIKEIKVNVWPGCTELHVIHVLNSNFHYDKFIHVIGGGTSITAEKIKNFLDDLIK